MRTPKIGVLVAAVISVAMVLVCIVIAIAGGRLLSDKYLELERDRSSARAYPMATRVAEAVNMHNWAFIEAMLKPMVLDLPEVAYFYVADDADKIQVSSATALAGESISDLDRVFTGRRHVETRQIKFLEVNDEFSLMNMAVQKLGAELPRSGSDTLLKGNSVLEISYKINKNAVSMGTIAFGFNIQPQLDYLRRAQIYALLAALLAALTFGLMILLITNRLMKPLATMADRIAAVTQMDIDFESNLRRLDISSWPANSQEMQIFRAAFARFRDIVLDNINEISSLKSAEAIARMTQMLAHDVRKPFSMLRAITSMIRNSKDFAEVKNITQMMLPEVDRALISVDGMLQDIIEVGAKSELARENVELIAVLDQSLSEVFSNLQTVDIDLSYQLEHTFAVSAEPLKLVRVFTNILNNAAQALDGKGKIWILSKNASFQGRSYVEIIIGNSGPLIPLEHIPKLFESFFTKNKRSGTGLGLAIAHKIVTAHKGTILCESTEETGVEFKLRLRAVNLAVTAEPRLKLPTHVRHYADRLSFNEPQISEGTLLKEVVSHFERILKHQEKAERQLRILVVDDELLYHSALRQLLDKECTAIAKGCELLVANSYAEAISFKVGCPLDLLIVDIDLGKGLPDGFDVVTAMRAEELSRAVICVHSNRFLDSDARMATKVGADAFLPKPMVRIHLLKLILSAYERM